MLRLSFLHGCAICFLLVADDHFNRGADALAGMDIQAATGAVELLDALPDVLQANRNHAAAIVLDGVFLCIGEYPFNLFARHAAAAVLNQDDILANGSVDARVEFLRADQIIDAPLTAVTAALHQDGAD